MLKVGRGGRIDIAIGVLAAALLEVRAAHAEAPLGDGLSHLWDRQSAEHVDALLRQAVSTGGVESLTADELAKLLTPERLAELGIDAKEFTFLLQADPEAAIAKLEAAFAKKLKLASFEAAAHKVNFAASEDSEGGRHQADGAGAAASGEGGISPLLILGGVFGAGLGAALIINGSGGGSSSGAGGQAVNSPPLANTDTVTTAEDGAVTFDPRTNDTDANGDTLTITQINGTNITTTAPVTVTGGVVSLNANGTLTFTPTANFNGTPSFTYTVSDGRGGTSTGTVNLTVTPVNDAPVAVVDTITTAEDSAITFDPRANDTDVDGNSLTITQINGTNITTTTPVTVTGGVVTLNANGSLTFTPNANYNGTPSFTYTISDGAGGTATSTVNLTVTAVNDAPVNTIPGALSGVQGGAVSLIGLSVGDVDSTSLTTTIRVSIGTLLAGTVEGGATITGNGTGTIVLTGTAAQINATLNALSFNGGAGVSGAATVTITTSDGSLTDTDSFTINLAQLQTGVLADGYISGATVFIDLNNNGVYDEGEPRGTTNADGTFAIAGATGTLVAFGGINTDTGLPNTVTFSAPAGSGVINPLTTILVNILANNPGMSLADAQAALATALGFAPGTDFTHLDFLNPNTDPVIALAGQKIAAQIATTLAALVGYGQDVQAAALRAISSSYATGVAPNLTSSSFLHDLFLAAGVPASQVDALAFQAAATNSTIDSATSLDGISNAQESGGSGTVSDTLHVSQTTIDSVVANASPLHDAGILHLDVSGPSVIGDVHISDAQADVLINAGIDFASQDVITVDVQGTTTSTSLKGLQTLHVDSVAVAGSVVTIEAGAGGLGALSADGLPSFTIAQSDAALDVTLNVAGGVLDPTLDLSTLASALAAAGIDHLGVDGATGSLELTSAQALALVNAGIDFTAADNITVDLAAGDIGSLTALAAAHVDHINVVGDVASIDDSTAASLIAAGVDFDTNDDVTLTAQGTTTSTTLHGLQTLHVDSVAVAGAAFTIEAGAGGLGGLDASGLPSFAIAQTDAALDVTLNVAGGTLDASLDLSSLASALATAGIDHLGVDGAAGSLELSGAQALALVNAGIDFTAADNITVDLAAGDLGSLTALAGAHVDHINVIGDVASISDTTAASLIAAGVDFDTSDNVTLTAQGTTTSTTLHGLQTLHVDSIAVAGSVFTIEAGVGGFGALSADGLPSFTIAQTDAALDVTLNVAGGTLDPTLDLSTLASSLSTAGIDHIGVDGDHGSLILSGAQANALVGAGLDFVAADDITVNLASSDLSSAVELGLHHVDHIDVIGDVASIDDGTAAILVASGVDFATGDDVTVQAHGTHMTTSLEGLQSLHVDTVVGDGFNNILKIDVGIDGLGALTADGGVLPHFASSLDVTLDIKLSDLDALAAQAAALHAAGIDHIGLDQPLDSLTADQLAAIANIASSSGLTIDYDPTPAAHADYGSLISLLEGQSVAPVDTPVAVPDALAASLVESGAVSSLVADTLVIDATQSGDKLLTSLKSMGDLGVDNVLLSDHGSQPVYVDLGFESATPTSAELTQLLSAVDHGSSDPLFSGSGHVGLVVDQASLDALAGVTDSLSHLQDLGITEIDVVDGTTIPDAFASSPIEIKLIGQTDDLYDYLHHQR